MEVVGSVIPVVIVRLSSAEADTLKKICDLVGLGDCCSTTTVADFAIDLADALTNFEEEAVNNWEADEADSEEPDDDDPYF